MRALPRVWKGMADSGTSSSASFLTSIFAAHYLRADQLGAYAVFFSAFVFCGGVVGSLVHVGAELDVLRGSGRSRLLDMPASIGLGAVVSVVLAVPAMALCTVIVPAPAVGADVAFLALTFLVLSAVSPAQDHARRLLHSSERSALAAAVSGVHLATVAAALVLGGVLDVPRLLVPGGCLVLGNLVSLGFAFVLRRRAVGRAPLLQARVRIPVQLRRGLPLALASMVSYATPYLIAVLLTKLVGIAAVGQLEAGRILSQPVLVLAAGALAVLQPRLYLAGRNADATTARSIAGRFALVTGAIGTAYLVLVGVPWPWDPLPGLFPAAYAVGGLLALQLLGTVLGAAGAPLVLLVLGAGQQARLPLLQLIALLSSLLAATSALVIGVFGGALAGLTASLVAEALYLRLALRVLRPPGKPRTSLPAPSSP